MDNVPREWRQPGHMGKARAKAAKKHAPQLRKTVFQVRYKPRLKYYRLLMSAAERLDGYADWQTNAISVTLRDYKQHRSILIDPQSFSYERDFGSPETAVEDILQLIKVLPAALELEDCIRMGFRRQYVVPVDMEFESLVTIMYVKFFSQDDRLRGFLPPDITDLLYRVDAKEGDNRYHLTLGPAKKDEIAQYIPFNRQNHLDPKKSPEEQLTIIGKPPELAILIDIDYFRTAEEPDVIAVNTAGDFLSEGHEAIDRLAHDFVSYLLATELAD